MNPLDSIAAWWRARGSGATLRPRRTNSFVLLAKDLGRRLTAPVLNFTYWTHLIIGVCFYGSIGIWAELLRRYLLNAEAGYGSIILAMHATYPAIIGATGMQLLLNKDEQTYVRSFAQLVSTISFSMAAVCVVAAEKLGEVLSFRIAAAGLVAAVLFWWIANALDEGLKDVDPSASTGGPLPDPSDIVPRMAQPETVTTAMGQIKI